MPRNWHNQHMVTLDSIVDWLILFLKVGVPIFGLVFGFVKIFRVKSGWITSFK